VDEDKCAQCGTPATPGAKFCQSCGAPLTAASRAVQGLPAAEPAPSHAAPGAQVLYQGVAIRFVAILIDLIITGIIGTILTVTFRSAAYYATATIGVSIIIELVYFTVLLGLYGQTVGMMIVRIKVVKEADYSAISYREAAIRTILLYIDEIPYLIPYLLGAVLIWTSDKKQRLGDRVAHTVVLKA